MKIEVGNLYVRVLELSDAERTWLLEYLAFDDSSARFRRGRRPGDDKIRMYNLVNNTFPTGYLPLVWTSAHKQGFAVELNDRRAPPCTPDFTADLEWLRHHPHAKIDPITHQIEAVQRAVAKRRGILWLPTGSGKTEIAIGLTKVLPCRWLFLVNSGDLLYQTAERYEKRTGDKAGIIGDGGWAPEQRFTVAMFQTLYARLGEPPTRPFMDSVEGLMIDEAHTLPASSFWRVSMMFRKAFYRFGLSATPLARGDKRSVLTIAATGQVIYRVRPSVLIEAGIIARPIIRLLPCVQMSTKPTWQGVYGEAIVRSSVRNRMVVDAVRRSEKPCLVFVREISHGRKLLSMLEDAGLKVEFVFGADATQERSASIRRLERNDIDVLISSTIFQQGVDIPTLASVVIASGGKSIIAALQKIGRGMRRVAGKDTFEVWDFADRGHKWLDRHTNVRLAAYTGEGYQPIIEHAPPIVSRARAR